jgi:hypothetical protein
MWLPLVLPLLFAVPAPPATHRPDELAERARTAGDDVAKLWEVALWCEAERRADEARDLLGRIVALEPDHPGAREKLRHHRYDGRWFETYRALAAYRRAEEAEQAQLGLERYGDGWAPAADVPFLRMGWTRGDDGVWIDPVDAARSAREAELAARGWQQQDLTWIAPEEFDRWRAGLFQCGDAWLDQAAADRWHAELGREWEIPGERFVVRATVDRESARWALWWADQTYPDLVRALGVEPRAKPRFVTLASLAQYNALASGDVQAARPAAEAAGWSSVHYAFQADSYVDATPDGLDYVGAGVCYWAVDDPALKPYGQHAVRHAAALAYLDAVDPSWDALAAMIAGGPGTPVDPIAFRDEKRLPTWLWYGTASWCERYFRDAHAADGQDPWWPRAWALQNLRDRGGLGALEDVFAFEIDTNDPDGAALRIAQAGLLVAFALDGGSAPVAAAHARVRELLASGAGRDEVSAAAAALERELARNEKALRRFAGL